MISRFFLSLLASISILLSGPALSEDDAGYLVGIGGASCGKVLDGIEKNEFVETMFSSWVLGYLSGINTIAFQPATVMAPVDGKKPPPQAQGLIVDISDMRGIERWILNYCKDNPLDMIAEATNACYAELLKRQWYGPKQRQ